MVRSELKTVLRLVRDLRFGSRNTNLEGGPKVEGDPKVEGADRGSRTDRGTDYGSRVTEALRVEGLRLRSETIGIKAVQIGGL